jgi:RNA polymerase sigma-70 factor (ECF subfamily)
LDYAVNLALGNPGTPPPGWNDETILEAIQIVAWSKFRATLAAGLGVSPDFVPIHTTPFHVRALTQAGPPGSLAAPALPPDFPSFQSLTGQIGFVPQIFRAQTLRPDSLQAQVQALLAIVFADGNLSRARKETLLRAATTSDAEKPLLNFATKLSAEPLAVAAGDIDALRSQGFTDEQLLEAIVVIALAGFFGVLQSGLGAGADFLPPSKRMHLLREEPRPTRVSPEMDPDAAVVARVQSGEVDAFEDLVNRHTRRVYRTLLGILGNSEEACDAVQETFLKAFRYLGNFQGRSKFSTWLVSIAHNTGIELLRARKPLESLDDDCADPDGSFRPRQIRAWTDDPEQLYFKAETQALVEASVMKLPAKYRVVLMLRDMERLSMEETASALGLGMPALKSRLLRGRLMVREALTPHFAKTAKGEPA